MGVYLGVRKVRFRGTCDNHTGRLAVGVRLAGAVSHGSDGMREIGMS
jgi:hypothetical protein